MKYRNSQVQSTIAPRIADVVTCQSQASQNDVVSMNAIRGGSLHNNRCNFSVVSWNVEGLSESKLVEIRICMQQQGIDALCLQETRRKHSFVQMLDEGYLFINSGHDSENISFAGCGFLLAPSARR